MQALWAQALGLLLNGERVSCVFYDYLCASCGGHGVGVCFHTGDSYHEGAVFSTRCEGCTGTSSG